VTRYLVDTNVFVYARGMEHRYRAPCRAILEAAQERAIWLEASVEMVQEFTHILLRRGIARPAAVEEAEDVRAQCRLHDFDSGVLSEALRLLRDHDALGVRDAVHAATAVRADLEAVISADTAFDALENPRRVDPLVLAEQLPTRPA
jgi:predicted nucleic acid-binding protein